MSPMLDDMILFRTFSTQEERRKFGGTDFMELQYCRLPQGTELKQVVSVDAIDHWKNDSLYIYGNDENEFMSYYGKIFTGGTYNNLECGPVDTCGINFYSYEQTLLMLEKVQEMKPLDYQVLANWLEKAKAMNGIYFLGL